MFATGFHRWNGRQSSRQETYPSVRQRSFLADNCDGQTRPPCNEAGSRDAAANRLLAAPTIRKLLSGHVKRRGMETTGFPIAELGKEIENKLLVLRVCPTFSLLPDSNPSWTLYDVLLEQCNFWNQLSFFFCSNGITDSYSITDNNENNNISFIETMLLKNFKNRNNISWIFLGWKYVKKRN